MPSVDCRLMATDEILLSARFNDALYLAADLHKCQARKGTKVPYVAHLLAVCSLVLEAGGDEDQAIAALLHDAVEDQGGEHTRQFIEAKFGKRVAGVVSECSDTDEDPKPPWRGRKERYLDHLRRASDDAVLVSLADKVHNTSAVLADYRELGEKLWGRFNAPKADQLWYYRSLVVRFRERRNGRLVDELDSVVTELEKLCGTE
jgi:(p)ppGpp synthase/HD superfamily hydrolase